MRSRAALVTAIFWRGRTLITVPFIIASLYDFATAQLLGVPFWGDPALDDKWPQISDVFGGWPWWGWTILVLVMLLMIGLEGAYRFVRDRTPSGGTSPESTQSSTVAYLKYGVLTGTSEQIEAQMARIDRQRERDSESRDRERERQAELDHVPKLEEARRQAALPASRFRDPEGLRYMILEIRSDELSLQREWRQAAQPIAMLTPTNQTNSWLAEAKLAIANSELGELEAGRLDTDSWIPIDLWDSLSVDPSEILKAISARLEVLQQMNDEISQQSTPDTSEGQQ